MSHETCNLELIVNSLTNLHQMLCCSFSQTSWCKKQAAGYLHTCMTPDKHPSHLGFSSTFGYERVTTLGCWRATHPACHPYYHLLAPCKDRLGRFRCVLAPLAPLGSQFVLTFPPLLLRILNPFSTGRTSLALAVRHWHQQPQFDAAMESAVQTWFECQFWASRE